MRFHDFFSILLIHIKTQKIVKLKQTKAEKSYIESFSRFFQACFSLTKWFDKMNFTIFLNFTRIWGTLQNVEKIVKFKHHLKSPPSWRFYDFLKKFPEPILKLKILNFFFLLFLEQKNPSNSALKIKFTTLYNFS